MNTISVELVPRDYDDLTKDLAHTKQFPDITEINVPDILRCPIRSWEAAAVARMHYNTVTVHIRACDINPENPELFFEHLARHNVQKILFVRGDIPHTYNRSFYSTTTVQAIQWCKRYIPHATVYAAIDPYRSSIQTERVYAVAKHDAGVDGFFTQPFFDIRLLHVWADILDGYIVYWGVAPVTTLNSKEGYWATKNHAVFPKHWDVSLEANQAFAREVIVWMSSSANWNVYLMPIKIDIAVYLSGIFDTILLERR